MSYQLQIRSGMNLRDVIAQVDKTQAKRFDELSAADKQLATTKLVAHFRYCRDNDIFVETGAIREQIDIILEEESEV